MENTEEEKRESLLKDNTGLLFVKKNVPSHIPDIHGTFKIAGENINLVGWKNKDKNGNVYIRLAVNKKLHQDAEIDEDW